MAADPQRWGRRCLDSPGDARSVLCSDWGVKRPDEKPDPKGEVVRSPPRMRLWETGQPVTGATVDWAAFSRETKRMERRPCGEGLVRGSARRVRPSRTTAPCFAAARKGGAVLIPKPDLRSAIEFTLLDPQGREAGPVESIRVLGMSPDEAALETSARSAGAVVKATWTISGSRALVQVTPLENADKLRIEVPCNASSCPTDLAMTSSPIRNVLGAGRTRRCPWAPLVTGLLRQRHPTCSSWSAPSQARERSCEREREPCFRGRGRGISAAGGVSAGVITCEGAWHLERFAERTGPADPLRFKWRMPCRGQLAPDGARRRAAVFHALLGQGIRVVR